MVKIFNGDVLKLGYEEPMYLRDTSSITEQAGYVDSETQIKRMMVAGATLNDFRRGISPGAFDFPDGKVPDDVKSDPTLDVGFDLADASEISKRLVEKAKASKKEEVKRSVTDDVADA